MSRHPGTLTSGGAHGAVRRARGGARMVEEKQKRPANIAEVARLAGVSTGTVSNVLNNPHRVAPATRERVQEVLRATGFVPSGAARRLMGAPSSTVGCVLTDLSDDYFAGVARGVEEGLSELGCLTIACGSYGDPAREQRYLRMLVEAGVRSIVLSAADAGPAMLRALLARGVPVTMLDDEEAREGVCQVGTDWEAAGRLVAGHLLGLGHRRVATVGYERALPAVRRRSAGVRGAVSERGLDAGDVLVEFPAGESWGAAEATDVVRRAMAGASPCTAFLCRDDTVAFTLLTALSREGIDVPGDVSVIGHGDRPFSAAVAPGLTTVRPPADAIGREAAVLAVDSAVAGHRHRRVVLAPELIVRGSTGPVPEPS